MGEDIYMLTRDASESERLNYQHKLLVKTIGYELHPRIEPHVGPEAWIADIATGTGVTLIDLAKSLPSTCQLVGFDLSSTQFPVEEDLPQNVKLHVTDAKAPFDSKFHGKFDVVNLRYLNAAMQAEDWEKITRNAYDLLKPGGWLQWLEGNFHQNMRWIRQDPRAPSSVSELIELFGQTLERFEYPGRELGDIPRRVGFHDVMHEITSTDRLPETRSAWTYTGRGPVLIALQMNERAKGPDGHSPEYCAKLVEKLCEEADAGVLYTRHDLHMFVGQK